jgi:hypothetical protein
MYGISPEEFFMYLTIALVFIIPISVWVYRRIALFKLKAQFKAKHPR